MFRNYLKIAVRNIGKHKGYSFINISGLALGMAICILIMLWVYDEWSYDRFHENADDLYRIIKVWRKGETSHQAVTPAPLAPALKEEFPEIIDTARFYPTGKWLLRHNDKAFYEMYGLFTDPSIFTMFTFPLVKGNRETALSHPRSMVITETLAAKYFGSENPIGKTIRVDNQYDFSITGVLKDIPRNSHFQFDFVVPFSLVGQEGLMARLAQKNLVDWHNTSFYSYILLKKNTSYKEFSRKISTYLKKPLGDGDDTSLLYLQPLKEIHLYSSHLRANVPGTGDITNIYLFSAMAFIILLMACINFMNLTTARGADRSKEIGIRKVVGARRTGIIKQFFSESFLLVFFALILSAILVELLLPAFSRLTGKQLTSTWLGNPFILPGMIAVTLVTGIMAGSYPAFFLSSFQPVKVLKNALKPGTKGGLSRKVLVIIQFSLAVIFLVGSTVIYRQLDYIKNKPLGFDKKNLLYMEIPEALRPSCAAFRNELRQNPAIIGTAASVSLPSFGRDINTQGVSWQGKEAGMELTMAGVGVDYDFIDTFKIRMSQGRNFSRAFANDASNYILNETAVKVMGIQAPVGKTFTLWDKTGIIIGVVKDYHFRMLYSPVEPLLIRLYPPQWWNYLYVRIKPGETPRALEFLEDQWKRFAPGYPFQYRFVDELLDNVYITEKQVMRIFIYLTILAISIACLGLYGLSAFLAEQRTREIGIRKVFGASWASVWRLFSGEFMKWIITANLLAWPIAYFLLDNLLIGNFAYRIHIGPWPFVLSGILTPVIALLTVGFQTFKAAAANPSDTLRSE